MITIDMATLISGVMSSPLNDVYGQKITIRPISLKGSTLFQLTFFKQEKTFHENLSAEESLAKINQCAASFKQVQLYTTEADLHFLRNHKGTTTSIRKAPTKQKIETKHNRTKQHLLEEGIPDPFLIGLGLMHSSGKLIPAMAHKFRQINRFLELVTHSLEETPKRDLHIVDLGCGKAYLTFALYHYLRHIKGWEIKLCGVDIKVDVIEECRTLAKTLGYEGLRFEQQNIKDVTPDEPVDIVVSLHACDIATDIALANGVKWGASSIFAAPCCQHELLNQISHPPMETLLRHGILKERFAAMATDAMRAELLEFAGYQTQVIEFIDLEHSPKNLMLRARWAPKESRQKKAWERYLQLKEMLQATPMLEKLLKPIIP